MLITYESSEVAAVYIKYRPKLTNDVADSVMRFCKSHQPEDTSSQPSLMVDVGCGSGQSTNIFHSYFKEIIGLDVSVEQLKQANKQNIYDNIKYLEGSAENMPVKTGSVDLLLASCAVHWFDMAEFMQEAKRVLKPSGCLAIMGYFAPMLTFHLNDADKSLVQKAMKLLAAAVTSFKDTDELSKIDKQLADRYKGIFEAISLPKKERNDDVHLRYTTSVNGLCGFISSIASYQSFMKKEISKLKENNEEVTQEMVSKIDPLQKLSKELLLLCGLKEYAADDPIVELDFNLFILFAKK